MLLDLFTMISIINNIENRERHFSSHCALNYTVFISSLKLVRLRSEYHPGESFERRIPADDTAEFAFFHLRCKISHCADLAPENGTTMKVREEWYIMLIGGSYGTIKVSTGADHSDASGSRS